MSFFFREGVTWTHRTNSAFAPRVLPAGCIFGIKGPAAFPIAGKSALELLGVLASRPIQALIEIQMSSAEATVAGSNSRSYDVGLVQRLPWPTLDPKSQNEVETLTASIVQAVSSRARHDELSRRFVAPVIRRDGSIRTWAHEVVATQEDNALIALDASWEVDQIVARGFAWPESATADIAELVGVNPASYAEREVDAAAFERLYHLPIAELVDATSQHLGGSRMVLKNTHVADRRLELLARTSARIRGA